MSGTQVKQQTCNLISEPETPCCKNCRLKDHHNVFSGSFYKPASAERRIISYPAIYFPDYWQVPDPSDVDRETYYEIESEAKQVGNESRMKPVNDFIRKFI